MKLAYETDRKTSESRANQKCETPSEIRYQWELQSTVRQSYRLVFLEFYQSLRRLANRRGISCRRQGGRIYLERAGRRYCIRYHIGRIELLSERTGGILGQEYQREYIGWMTPEQAILWVEGKRRAETQWHPRYGIHFTSSN